ncbi:hypothetical protein WJX74_010986 [Apatococcus lobatus]|uniref:Transposase n=1 Tax=Apatococcus lobatus TaxID=904363 RepID=A0AAW1QI65_9CHLO
MPSRPWQNAFLKDFWESYTGQNSNNAAADALTREYKIHLTSRQIGHLKKRIQGSRMTEQNPPLLSRLRTMSMRLLKMTVQHRPRLIGCWSV